MATTPVIGSGSSRANLLIKRGVTLSQILTIKEKDTGAALNITGYSFDGAVTDSTGAVIQALTFAITDAPNGKVRMSLTSGQTTALTRGDEFFFVSYDDTLAQTFLLIEGQALIRNIGET